MKLKYKTRVLVFTYEKEDFEEEIKTLKKVGRLLSQRLSIRIGFIEDRDLIRLYKKRYSSNWFIDLVFSNAIVLQRFDKKIIPVDIYNLQGTKLLLKEFSKGSLLSLNKLDKETQRLLEMTGQNIVVGVVSLDNKDEKIRQDSQEFKDETLPIVVNFMVGNFNFAIADYEEGETKEILAKKGFGEKDLPLIYGIDFYTNEYLVYNGELDLESISKWLMQNE